MNYTCFDVTIENNIAHIVLNRPEKRNSMNVAFWDELPAIIQDIDNESRARVIVISSTGPHFSSGLDISAFLANDNAAQEGSRPDPKEKRVKGENCIKTLSVCRRASRY